MTHWVLLRGLARESRHWGDFVDALRAVRPGIGIVTVDLPGNGRLNDVDSPADIETMAEHVRTELVRLGHRPPHRVLGLSMGAMVAVAWATRHPDELAGAVLINTSLRPFCPFWQRLRPAQWGSLLKLALTSNDAGAAEARILRLTSRRAPAPGLLQDWATWRSERPVSAANALRQLRAAARFRAPATRPMVPLLVLASAGDALVDPRCSQALASAWHCPLAMHPDAGHDLPLDDPSWVARTVGAWLDGREGRDAEPLLTEARHATGQRGAGAEQEQHCGAETGARRGLA